VVSIDKFDDVLIKMAPFLPPEDSMADTFSRFQMMDADAIVDEILRNDLISQYISQYRVPLSKVIKRVSDGEIRKHLSIFLDTYYPGLIADIDKEYEAGNTKPEQKLRAVFDKMIGVVRGAGRSNQ